MMRAFMALLALVLMLLLSAAGVTAARSEPPHPACGIAPWTGTCSCTPPGGHYAMSYADFATLMARDPHGQGLPAEARAACRLAGT